MKNIVYIFLAFIPVMLWSCSDDDVNVVTTPSERGTVTDDMGNVYNWVRIGDLEWTTSNAKNGVSMFDLQYLDWGYWEYMFSDSEREEMEADYVPVHGNLMNYEDALASAPEGGWRVPSDEDWKNLERALGMTDADNQGWRGNGVAARLMDKNGVEMGMTLGGNIRSTLQNDGNYSFEFDSEDECGYYWTSTMEPSYTDSPMAYFRKLVAGVSGVERRCTSAESLLSVRWCRDAR